MKPHVLPLAGDGLQQLSYDLPHRIHAVKIYPLVSPSGSTVIVYGHENGLRIVWTAADQPRDLQDEMVPFASLLHTYDIQLGGTEVLHIATPQMPQDVHHDTQSVPKWLAEKLVIVAACSDCNIRVITLPLAHSENVASEQILTLSGNPNHQNLPNSVSISFTPRPLAAAVDTEVDEEAAERDNATMQTSSRPTSRASRRSSTSVDVNWDLLIASHSPDLLGRLILHRIPCNKSSLDDSAESIIPWRTYCLQSPAVSIQFCSALYPSPHHSRLLVAEAHGQVKILECAPRGASSPWLASFDTDFEAPSGQVLPKRKRIVDSRWLLGGRAIIVLLSNGEWGVWDIGSGSPRPAEAASQVLNPAGMSQFAVYGCVRTDTATSIPVLENSRTNASKFAPMTPSTRKSRQAALFIPETQLQQVPSRGGISIVPASKASSSRADDETILLWHGRKIIIIPSFCTHCVGQTPASTHWQNQVRGSSHLLGAKGEIKTISDVQFQGEACSEMSLNSNSTGFEIVVATEHRLIVIAPAHSPKRRSTTHFKTPVSAVTDERLLATGELDINGMDRVLDGMLDGYNAREVAFTPKCKVVRSQ